MRLAKNSSVFVKVAMVLMLVLSVLISGCTGNDEKEWKKTRLAFTGNYGAMAASYTERENKRMNRPVAEWDELQKNSFYITREQIIVLNETFEKLQKMAKGNKEREKIVEGYKHQLEDAKRKVLSTGKYSRIVPKEHLNFDKSVNVPKVEKKDKNNNNKETEVKKENQSKQISVSETKKEESTKKSAIITGTEVRFRQDGNLNGKVLGYFDKGEKVTVLAKENGWCKVQRGNGTVGYVSSDFCK